MTKCSGKKMEICTHRIFSVSFVLKNCDLVNGEEYIQKILTKKVYRHLDISISVKEFTGGDHRYFMNKLKVKK